MTAWFVIVVPIVIMFFALFMERVEARLRHVAVQENEVEEFLESARPDEVKALYGHGIGRASGAVPPSSSRPWRGAQARPLMP